jgi:hypothetical protein
MFILEIWQVCVGSAEGVEKIIVYQREGYVNFPVRWAVETLLR